MNERFDIIIAGGGLVGSVMAICVARLGLRAALIERARAVVPQKGDAGFDGRSYALALASQILLKNLGLWSGLHVHAQPILRIKITDGRVDMGPGFGFLDFDHAEIEEGPMGYMVEDRHLRPALRSALDQSDLLTAYFEREICSHHADHSGVEVMLDDGRALKGALLLACDGAHSPTAQKLGIKKLSRDYHQSGLVCALSYDGPQISTAYQYFLPEGPLAVLPLKEQRVSLVWSESTERAKAIMDLSPEDYLRALRPRLGDFLGKMRLCGARYSYPLLFGLTERMVDARVALIGDAAHKVHPIAGQGLNAGLRDIAAMAHVLREASCRGEDIGQQAVLQRYQKWRRFDNTSLAMATHGFNQLFSNSSSLLRHLRGIGLRALAHTPPLRRSFIREAAGLTGQLPEWMRE